MEDWEGESPNDEDDRTEIENELYSMFYYHSMTEGIPGDLSGKYNVDVDDFVTISLKSDKDTDEKSQLTNDEGRDNITVSIDRYIDGCKGSEDIIEKQSAQIIEKPSIQKLNKEDENSVVNKVINEGLKPPFVKLNSNDPTSSRIRYFHASRYFSLGTNNVKKLLRNKYNDSIGSPNPFKSSKLISPRGILHRNSMFSSTPKIMKKVKQVKQNRKVILNSNQDLVIIKDNVGIVDLTKNKKISCSSSNDSDPVITISSGSDDGEDDGDHRDEISIDSDSDYDSDDSTVMTLDSILLNTSMPVDLNDCDISVINVDYDWRKTSSPESWTKSMRKFYNKPSEKLLNFDYRSILREIRGQGSSDWSINKADMHRFKSSRHVRCLRCRQEGHVKADCTKSFGCHICGTPGHISKKCPQKMCLKCGSKSKEMFPSGCGKCPNRGNVVCDICGNQGHISSFCTEAWRSHSLIDLQQESLPRTGPKYCCNCAKSGHYFEDCNRRSAPNDNVKMFKNNGKRKHFGFTTNSTDRKKNKRIAMLRRKSNKKKKFKHLSTTI